MTYTQTTVPLNTLPAGTTLVLPSKPNQLYMKVDNYPSHDPAPAFVVRLDDGWIDGMAKGEPVIVVSYKAVKE